MNLPKCFAIRFIFSCMLGPTGLLILQACGATESFTEADVLGSYLYVDELNIAAGGNNQAHLACKRSNGKPLGYLAVQVAVSKAGMPSGYLAQDWLETDGQGQQVVSFTLPEPGMYSLALQLKLPGSGKVFTPEHAYTAVQVLDEQAIGIGGKVEQDPLKAGKPVQMIARGTALNSQVLLLDDPRQLLQQEHTIRFQSSDNLAILPDPIRLTAIEGGNKLFLKSVKLYTLGEQTILAIEEETSQIVSEQRYQVTLGAKNVYRAFLQKPQEPVVADGQSVAQVHLTLSDGSGEAMRQMEVALVIGQGSATRSLAARTDDLGKATFAWSEVVAGNKPLELFLRVPSGMIPIQQDSLLFVPGVPARLRFMTAPTFAKTGEILGGVPKFAIWL